MEAQNVAKLQKCFFVFLLVRPYCDTACDMCVDTVLGGKGLSAKIKAKNESLRKSSRVLPCSAPAIKRWRILLGFYAHKSTWMRKIKNQWTKGCHWEEALLQGVKFAVHFSVNHVLYISSEARSKPPSPLLCGLQHLSSKGNSAGNSNENSNENSEENSKENSKEKVKMMSIIMSNKTASEKLLELVQNSCTLH